MMASHEDSPLVCKTDNKEPIKRAKRGVICVVPTLLLVILCVSRIILNTESKSKVAKDAVNLVPAGPYTLVEVQEGKSFFTHYNFFNGPDSVGSAGYNTYVSQSRAEKLGIASIITDDNDEEFVYMASAPTEDGPRESVRLEGKTRFERGLFILDVRHMPDGCGVWPAFWLTDEENWPNNGEIDILEGVNGQTTAKTALHTSDKCDMFQHVAPYAATGQWERITGVPDHFTGELDFETNKGADNCDWEAPHQWYNEGCTFVHDRDDTIGGPVNAIGGGLYVLEWDPVGRYHESGIDMGYIKAWVFTDDIPRNLNDVIATAGLEDASQRVMPWPESWNALPYAYYTIGDGDSGCSADHFKNMRIVINLAFCGAVSGNRFSSECPKQAGRYNATNDPVTTCNAYIKSNPKALEEAYWKIKVRYMNKDRNTSDQRTHLTYPYLTYIREFMCMKESWNNERVKTYNRKKMPKRADTFCIISTIKYIIAYHLYYLFDRIIVKRGHHHGMRTPSAKKEPDL
jgi:hypothetical protein